MTEDQIDLWADAMLLKISVITGWVLPTQILLNVLTDQLKKKMLEAYSDCNPEEIEYAFRNYSSYVKDWGKQLNLSLIDEVMIPYLARRSEQSKAEERALPPTPPEPEKQESLTDFAMLRWLAREIQYLRTGKPWEFIPEELYDFLDKKGAIKATNAEKYDYLQKATTRRAGQLEREAVTSKHAKEYFQRFRRMVDKGCLYGIEGERVKKMAKKLLFFDLVQQSASCNTSPTTTP